MPRPTPRRISLALTIAGCVVLYVVACIVGKAYGYAFFSIPFYPGVVAGLLSPSQPYRTAFYALGISFVLALLTLQEGVVCLLFGLPVIMPTLWLGAWAGAVLRLYIRSRRVRNGTIAGVLLLGAGAQYWDAATDDVTQHPIHIAVTERSIDAPPARVFETLTARELRVPQRWPWFIRVGLPMPEAMIVERPGLGGQIRFEFARMTAHARITTLQPPRELQYTIEHYDMHDLPFHITRLGSGPDYGVKPDHVTDWLTILDTQYSIRAAPNAHSILRRRVVWQRHLTPKPYFSWLQQTVMERGQARLLELIDQRIEQSETQPEFDADSATSRAARKSSRR